VTQPIRTRFAPSPTGKLHIGGARTALFAWAYARRHGGQFLLRIEDTDAERSTPENERLILEGLSWLGLEWDEGPDVGGDFGPYRQTERFERYEEVANSLVDAGHAFWCFDTPENLERHREAQRALPETGGYRSPFRGQPQEQALERIKAGEKAVMRFKVPEGETSLVDQIRGNVTFPNNEVEDWVMVRSSGVPTYNFVVVVDDSDMDISHVMRGEEHLTNTPKQVLLYEALEIEPPSFAHLPLMLGTDGKKLSKRTGDTALQDYRDKGYSPEAVANFLCLQGWALDDKTEVFGLEQLIANFDPKDVSKGGSIFDPKKFLWMAGEYIHNEPIERFVARATPFVVAADLMSDDDITARGTWFTQACKSVQERVHLYSEVPDHIGYLFTSEDEVVYDEKALKNTAKQANGLEVLANFTEWLAPRIKGGVQAKTLGEEARAWVKEQDIKFPALFMPLRCALTGKAGGPDLFEVMALLGPERTLARIDAGLRRLAE
jgi:glutamyl-tRNA synthetase